MTDNEATCAADSDTCVEGDAATCDGNVLRTCTQALLTYTVEDGSVADNVWLWQGTDGAADGQVCAADGSGAACTTG